MTVMHGSARASLWWYDGRRVGWASLAAPLAAVATVALLAVAAHGLYGGRDTGFGLLRLTDALVPVAAGLATATAVGREENLELQLSLPMLYRRTLTRRVAVVLVVVLAACALSVALMGVLGQWHHPATGVLAVVVPFAPALFLSGAGAWATARTRAAAAGSVIVIGCWLAEVLLLDKVVHDWVANRLLLLVAGAVALAAAARRVGRYDALLGKGAS